MRYLITAYKSESADYCRGCLMESYGSDFEFINTLDRGEAIQFISKILLANKKLGHGETGYELQWHHTEDNEEIFIELTGEYAEAEKISTERLEEEKRLEEIEKKEAEARRLEEKRQQELRQLAALQAKYGEAHA